MRTHFISLDGFELQVILDYYDWREVLDHPSHGHRLTLIPKNRNLIPFLPKEWHTSCLTVKYGETRALKHAERLLQNAITRMRLHVAMNA